MSDSFRLLQPADLGPRNTFGVAAHARRLIEVLDAAAVPQALAALDGDMRPLVIGGGSNLLFAGDAIDALAIIDARRSVVSDDGERVVVRAAAGADWHGFVLWTLAQELGGMENLALIPGTVGAAPIQNIGAYGVEVGEHVVAVEAFDQDTRNFVRLDRDACRFGYRDSIFKQLPDRWIVTAVEFALHRFAEPVLDYAGLRDVLAARGITAPRPLDVAEAVIDIRRSKLPDPAVIGNAGSFFKNPIVPAAQAAALVAAHAGIPVFAVDEGLRKLSAAWLIDRCGWKGHRDGDAGVAPGHALVLVNHGNAQGTELLGLARRIAASVQMRFGVALEPEPKIVGAAW
ncbi:UDP-N-acetylmuramate dehydrogenase [Luteimonas fraxinea]|uniref:UDP-N-acetylenolpyruvoylglucosamine reductase n=2 Tax=Luteimonas fraxinea TaxID=2901869 RepID=A0ABS8UEA5_9GAMM|nr:UDP-N-acetylmuramate dehydrogenase [Luteimonas fraxinea]MCD9096850.1 UDP-N-acetylmuramate dehydrogenase [Luteimonas fraxinea]MCD9126835.1 UDP-N-acetylmuramate dehydrogenase [Luteimonas fraxinea]UHH09803.1 UDP-N-acetylmuramate dehydrogenase [Luteimonas fraxinea]